MTDDRDRPDELTPNDPAHTASRAAGENAREREARDDLSTTGETTPRATVGHEAAGAAGGAAVGAAAGTISAGPIGTILGAIAGALGGWWVGAGASSQKRERYTEEDDRRYREHFESEPNRLADRGFEDARAGYVVGHLARQNPDFSNRQFDDVEPSLERAWSQELERKYGDWAGLRGYVRTAFSNEGPTKGVSTDKEQDRIESLQDPLPGE